MVVGFSFEYFLHTVFSTFLGTFYTFLRSKPTCLNLLCSQSRVKVWELCKQKWWLVPKLLLKKADNKSSQSFQVFVSITEPSAQRLIIKLNLFNHLEGVLWISCILKTTFDVDTRTKTKCKITENVLQCNL